MAKKKGSVAKKKDKTEVLEIKRVAKNADLPDYSVDSDVAFDLRANETIILKPFEQKEIPTGIAIKIPPGFVGLVRDRAGITTEMALHTVAGIFDPLHQDEIKLKIINYGEQEVRVERGMRVSQMIIVPVKKLKLKEVSKF